MKKKGLSLLLYTIYVKIIYILYDHCGHVIYTEKRIENMDSLQELWTLFLSSLLEKNLVSADSYRLWLESLELKELTATEAKIYVPQAFKINILKELYTELIETHFSAMLGFPVKVFFYHDDMQALPILELIPNQSFEKQSVIATDVLLGQGYTFENFIVGTTNRLAHSACLAVANRTAQGYNPLLIYGDSGLGKTHLLFAITNHIHKNTPDSKILYVKGEDFTNELVNILTQKKPMQYFRDKYRSVDVLLIDDIQFIAGKSATQEEFFHTFNALYDDNKQIILTSDRPPKEMKTLEDRLLTRFEGGLIVDIQPPDLELRIAILKKKAEQLGIDVPNDVLFFLADRIKSNIRTIEGAIKRLNAYSFLGNGVIDMNLAKQSIADLLERPVSTMTKVEQIFDVVSQKYNISVEDIKSAKQIKEITFARQVAMLLLRRVTELSLDEIGKLNGKHHSTVMYAIG
ncbi:MAG TPA: chromosomal replication initiator protein DnaA, partial [Clostridiales bacterium]|nr:chromosomal replication initiator protein DnaA [Clostridiales bacterium]